jgi:hypothetical protein
MIIPSSSTNRAPLSQPLSNTGQTASSSRVQCGDRLSTGNAAQVKAALERQPAIRPEMLARARALAADPSCPPEATMKLLAKHLLSSPDLSSDES